MNARKDELVALPPRQQASDDQERDAGMAADKQANAKGTEEYLTVSEVADIFHVSSKTIVRWADDGRLPHMVTLGGHRRFPRAPIEAIVAELQRGPEEGR